MECFFVSLRHFRQLYRVKLTRNQTDGSILVKPLDIAGDLEQLVPPDKFLDLTLPLMLPLGLNIDGLQIVSSCDSFGMSDGPFGPCEFTMLTTQNIYSTDSMIGCAVGIDPNGDALATKRSILHQRIETFSRVDGWLPPARRARFGLDVQWAIVESSGSAYSAHQLDLAINRDQFDAMVR